MTNHLESLDQVRRILVERSTDFVPKFLVAALILTAGILLGRWIGRLLEGGLTRFDLEPPVRQLLVRLVRVVVLVLFLILALQNLGVQLLPLIAGLGVAGAGIALAMQGVLGNVVAGLTIIFTRPFRVGEYVSMAGEEGRVESIDLLTTTLGHPDLSRVVVPNRKIVGEVLHNYGKIRQLDVAASVSYDTDLARALEAIREVLDANARVLKDPAPVLRVAQMGSYSIDIAVKPWVAVADFGAVRGEINQAILELFRQRNIQIPFPQHEVRLLGN